MNAPMRLQPPRRWARRHLRLVRRRFHEDAFGEELARVNLDFTPAERLRYLDWMRGYARLKGVKPQPSYSVAWLLEVEDEVRREHPELSPP
jgi:hypothetical protein